MYTHLHLAIWLMIMLLLRHERTENQGRLYDKIDMSERSQIPYELLADVKKYVSACYNGTHSYIITSYMQNQLF